MVSAIHTAAYLCQPSSSSSTIRKSTIYSLSTSISSKPNATNFRLSTWIPQLGLTSFSQWNGLRHMGISISLHSVKSANKRKCEGKGVFASLFGVGAPEALVIGVVALLVFGPKGLAEVAFYKVFLSTPVWIQTYALEHVARNLGKTLREFQPTIRELQDVSREFKSTLEREIGLDDVQSPTQRNYSPSTTNTNPSPSTVDRSEDSQTKAESNGSPSTNQAYTSEDYLKITEEQLKVVAEQQIQTESPGETQSALQTQSQDIVQEAAAVAPPSQNLKSEA